VEEQDVMTLSVEGGGSSQQSINPLGELLDQGCGRVVPERGEVIEGTIVSISPSEMLIDVGCKSEGVVYDRDFERLDPEYRESLRVGGKVMVCVVRPEDSNGNILLSLSRAQLEDGWREASKLFEAKEVFEETVIGCNKGGLIVNVGRVRGFVPASQVVTVQLPREGDDAEREKLLEQLVNKKLRFKIIELDRRRNRLILSERVALREWRQERKDRLLDELAPGVVRRGVVSSLCDFGAFIDLGGADGLVHLSELSWRHVDHPKQVLRVGQEVDIYVLEVDKEKRRIALSIKRLQKEPWSTVEERFRIGQLVTGKITKLTNFGAFARLDEDIEGLVHISELSDERIAHPRDVVEEGQELTLRVIRIDASRQRLGLSLRRVSDDQYSDDYNWQESGQLVDLGNSTENSQNQ
jgi:small subunit ribosomal protein S1